VHSGESRGTGSMTSRHIAIDRIRCDGRGLCADLIPEMIHLDDWGYPVIDSGPTPGHLRDHARRAVTSCPVLALRLERRDASGR
jgi:ferredoxin